MTRKTIHYFPGSSRWVKVKNPRKVGFPSVPRHSFDDLDLMELPHRRLNILTQQWIICSPQRAKRPWLGQSEKKEETKLPSYDPTCFLCPGNKRASEGEANPQYDNTLVFPNDFPSFLPGDVGENQIEHLETDLLISQPLSGCCKVICFTPRHDLTLAEMNQNGIEKLIQTWKEQYEDIGSQKDIQYVQVCLWFIDNSSKIFENKGAVMGCSNPHPHCQIWAGSFIPQEVASEIDSMANYLSKHKRCLLCDYLKVESKKRERIIYENEMFVVLVPFWAVWPYETLVLSKKHIGNLSQFDDSMVSEQLFRLTTDFQPRHGVEASHL